MQARKSTSAFGQVRRFLSDTRAATAIEYTLIAGFVGLAIVVGVTTVGTKLGTFFTTLAGNW
jgi:pilus assembly protein Flp/PilA